MKEIPLTKDKIATVDDEVYEYLCQWKWTCHNYGYARTRNSSMHRVVYEYFCGSIPEDLSIDHINQDKLDNRIENLRAIPIQENLQNKGFYKNNNSGFKGVSWSKAASKWKAQANKDGKQHYLGCFNSPEEAHHACLTFLESE